LIGCWSGLNVAIRRQKGRDQNQIAAHIAIVAVSFLPAVSSPDLFQDVPAVRAVRCVAAGEAEQRAAVVAAVLPVSAAVAEVHFVAAEAAHSAEASASLATAAAEEELRVVVSASVVAEAAQEALSVAAVAAVGMAALVVAPRCGSAAVAVRLLAVGSAPLDEVVSHLDAAASR
jgi:hypothetical protein